MAKKYYWLKLNKDFFRQKEIKKLRRIAGGDTYTIIYLKMQLLSITNDGILEFTGLEDTFSKELALELDEDVTNVEVTLNFLEKCGLLEVMNETEFLLTDVPNNTGKESESAERVRKLRDKKKNLALQCNGGVTKCNTEIEKEIEKEKDKIKIEIKNMNISNQLKSKLYEFVDYRKAIKKTLKTTLSIKSTLNKIGVDFIDEQHLMDSIDQSIRNEYTGIFPTKNYKPSITNKSMGDRASEIEAFLRGGYKTNNTLEAEVVEDEY